jgi:hypothetical protein
MVFYGRPAHLRHFGPLDMGGARTVTSFAADADLGPGGMVGVGCEIVVFLEVGGVAFGTHAIPVLALPGPIQPILGV